MHRRRRQHKKPNCKQAETDLYGYEPKHMVTRLGLDKMVGELLWRAKRIKRQKRCTPPS